MTFIHSGSNLSQFSLVDRYILLLYMYYRHKCFTGKYTTCKIHTRLHPGPKWRIFHILTSEDIGDLIFCLFTFVCASNQ